MKGSAGDNINAIATVESVAGFAEAATRRFFAWAMCDLLRAGIGPVERALEEAESLLVGGTCS